MVNTAQGFIEIEVVFALLQVQTMVALKVPPGTTVRQAIIQSDIAAKYPEIDPDLAIAGIFGRRVRGSTLLHAHDRVEIYRPLIADPKQARRRRASQAVKAKR